MQFASVVRFLKHPGLADGCTATSWCMVTSVYCNGRVCAIANACSTTGRLNAAAFVTTNRQISTVLMVMVLVMTMIMMVLVQVLDMIVPLCRLARIIVQAASDACITTMHVLLNIKLR